MQDNTQKEFKSYKTWQERIGHWQGLLVTITSLGALLMASWSQITSAYNQEFIQDNTTELKENSVALDENKRDIEKLLEIYDVAQSLGEGFKIDYPADGDETEGGKFKVRGTWKADLRVLKENKVIVFVRDGSLYFPAQAISTVAATGEWSAEMVIGVKGNLTLLATIVTKSDAEWMKKWISGTNGKGLDEIPSQFVVLDEVEFISN